MKTSIFPCALMLAAGALAQPDVTEFLNPPNAAKPHTWFHMMNGNVTKAGITRDFEELAKAGIGGVQMFDAGCAIPPGGLDFNSPEWFEMFRHAASEARRLGLEICIPNCSGWSSSGGPWIAPSNAMKRVVVAETSVKGGTHLSKQLSRTKDDNGFYEDIAVLAIPVPPADRVSFPNVTETCPNNTATLSSATPFTVSALSYRLDYPKCWSSSARTTIEVSDDGATFRTVETFETVLTRSGVADYELRFHNFAKPITARAVRIAFKSSNKVKVREFHPEQRLRLADVRGKTFATRSDIRRDVAAARPDQTVPKDAVIDLTDKLAADGTLTWDAPAGDWKILRIGYVCNGQCNLPASDHGKGLEVDKLSAAAMDFHFEQYVARLCRTLGPLAGDVPSGFNNILVDSYEVGSQNWTQNLEATFAARRGYSLRPYLPVFAGYVVGSVEETERFLEDFRRVVADLFAENYTGELAKKCHEYGLKCSIEPYGNCPADNLQYGEYCDIPMGEFWSHASDPYGRGVGNAKYASYIAHVWGRKYCATESFTAHPGPSTGRWMTTPFSIKAQGDSAYAHGVNRIIYHRFTHQPWADDRYLPGMTMGRWGMHFDRTQTWWEFVKPWLRYQARCQHLLQQGTFCADVLFFAGEQTPNQGGNTDGSGASVAFYKLPEGYDSDTCPTDAMYRLKVEDGCVVVPGGVKYRILAIPPMEAVSPEMVACIAKLCAAGATVVWPKKPVRAPGLKWGADGDAQVRAAAGTLWAKGILACTPAEAIARLGIAPDVKLESSGAADVKAIKWLHRRDATADWYFTAMPNHNEATAEVSFRQTGRLPELWDAETGTCRPADVWRKENGRTYVTIPYTVCGSKFVVFRKIAPKDHLVSCAVKARRRADPVGGDAVRHTLVIKKALYGVSDGQLVDVTAKLASLVRDGMISVTVNNRLAGCDPMRMTVKNLYLTYDYDGVEKETVVCENQRLSIPEGAARAVPMPDGAWREGTFYAAQPLTVTRTTASGKTETWAAEPPSAQPVAGAWTVSFPHDFLPNKLAQGADEKVVFERLHSWAEDVNEGVRYFSGVATYEKTLDAVAPSVGARLVLDLGNVKDFAEVSVNGHVLASLWKPPFRVDITDAVKPGEPTDLRIRVANLWANRLIGDDRQHADDCAWKGVKRNGVKEIGIREIPQWVKDGKKSPTGRCTFTTWKHWDKDDQLLPSGILGPVYLRTLVPCTPSIGVHIE